MRDLRESNDASDPIPKNQTVFVRTRNFNLTGETWDDLNLHKIRSGKHLNGDGPQSNLSPPSSPSGGKSSSGSGESHSSHGMVNFQAAQFGLSVGHASMFSITSQTVSQVVQHPSNQLNDLWV